MYMSRGGKNAVLRSWMRDLSCIIGQLVIIVVNPGGLFIEKMAFYRVHCKQQDPVDISNNLRADLKAVARP